MLFILLVAFTAFLVAICAAFFSIKGLIVLFSGNMLAVGIMAGALELGKLVAASYLHTYWKKTGFLLKTYLCSAVFVLMLVTSLGIFGFLTGSYQKHSNLVGGYETQITVIEQQKTTIEQSVQETLARVKSLNELRKDQEERIKLAANNRLAREQAYKAIGEADQEIRNKEEQISAYRLKIIDLDKQAAELKLEMNTTTDVGSFKFVANSLGTDVDTSVRYFIFALMFVFDPLAVTLVLALNRLLEIRREEKKALEKKELEEILNRAVKPVQELYGAPPEIAIQETQADETHKEEPEDRVQYSEEMLKAIEEEKARRRKIAGKNNSILTL